MFLHKNVIILFLVCLYLVSSSPPATELPTQYPSTGSPSTISPSTILPTTTLPTTAPTYPTSMAPTSGAPTLTPTTNSPTTTSPTSLPTSSPTPAPDPCNLLSWASTYVSSPSVSLFATYGAQNFPVCIMFGNVAINGTFSPLKHVLFWPVVDTYSLLELSNSSISVYNTYPTIGNISASNFAFQIQAAGAISPVYRKNSADGSLVAPWHVATIVVSSGTPTGIQFDDGCYGCAGSSSCLDGFCTVSKSMCLVPQSAGGSDCNFQVY